MANAPFDSYQGFCKHSFISDEKSWVALELNKSGRNEGKYDFSGDSFLLKGSAFAGLVDGGNHWLIATLASGSSNGKEGVFEFKAWKNGSDGAKGSFDKAAGDELAKQWQIDGCNAAINVNAIPALKVFVKVLSELKIIVTNEPREILVRLNLDDAALIKLEHDLSVFWAYLIANEGNTPEEGTDSYQAAIDVNEAGLMSIPALTDEMLPSVPLFNIMKKQTGVRIECFPFEGTMPCYDKLIITLPKKEEKKSGSGGNWGGGIAPLDPREVLKARSEFVIKAYNDSSLCTNAITLKDVFDTGLATKEGKEYLEFLTKIMGR